ncbi:hypothetical protein G7Y89_g13269 [Cudoniella acicularis]|uniref:Squalene cyclase N-terminal domain-containing protein n=1 Tax=Cudoniella acicularis TaxID=354080 RepID=A0A8H4R8W0_9HELO|nr:hypothetical protein G7Y89_g13269 [Cudoniella acicularis]
MNRKTVGSREKTPSPPITESQIDTNRWRMRDIDGRLTWHYLEDDEETNKWPQSYADKWYLGLPTGLPKLSKPKTPTEAAKNGLTFFSYLQLPFGSWGSEFGDPMFLLPGIVITWYCKITKTPIPLSHAIAIKNYMFARANPSDGGWGLYIEAESSILGTALNYAVL